MTSNPIHFMAPELPDEIAAQVFSLTEVRQ
jgi:hypothetical protein